MRKHLVFSLSTLLVVLSFVACNDAEEKLAQQQSEYEKLLAETQRKDSAMLSLVTAFNEIDENLQVIKEKEGIINTGMDKDGMTKDYKQRVMEDIQSIYSLMETNKAKIAELNDKLAAARNQVGKSDKNLTAARRQLEEFERMIASLTEQIAIKDHQISELTDRLVALNFALDSLSTEYKAKSELAAEQEKELNTAYYVFDSKKGLKEHNIIESKGGVIGIGATKMLAEDFNKDYFTKINILETTSIGLYAKDAKMLTNHPSGSYKMEEKDGHVEKIVITDPVAFWSTSKYLVILVE